MNPIGAEQILIGGDSLVFTHPGDHYVPVRQSRDRRIALIVEFRWRGRTCPINIKVGPDHCPICGEDLSSNVLHE